MKAHINTAAAKPLALHYGLPEDKRHGLCAVLEEMGIAHAQILPEQLGQPVGLLAGIGGKAAAPYTGEAPNEQLLLLSNLERAELNRLLDSLRDAGVSIPLKAIVTKHNKTWSVIALLEELGREREAVKQYKAANHSKGEAK